MISSSLRSSLFRLFEIEIHPFLDVRHLQDLFDRMIHAVVDQLHHQVIVGNPEIAEPAQSRPGIHQIVQQHPTGGVQDFIHGEVGAVALVHRFHQLVADAREGFFAAVVVVYHAGRAARLGVDNQLSAGFESLQPVHFGFMMVKSEFHPRVIRQVGGDIVLAQFHLPVLHVLGMDELDIVDQVQFLQHHGACQSVKIAARYQSHFFSHVHFLLGCIVHRYIVLCCRDYNIYGFSVQPGSAWKKRLRSLWPNSLLC